MGVIGRSSEFLVLYAQICRVFAGACDHRDFVWLAVRHCQLLVDDVGAKRSRQKLLVITVGHY